MGRFRGLPKDIEKSAASGFGYRTQARHPRNDVPFLDPQVLMPDAPLTEFQLSGTELEGC
jgi:hypothetical protein